MGLDFTHCEAHWSYSDFHDFRKRLAAGIGMNLDDRKIQDKENKLLHSI
ncbi:hypothetical protein NSQ36_08885 [Bacillus sp. FSL W8-1143]|nr:hypothetical protein [Bacillus pumilus]MCM3147573.1 hypothetical protein [Bacillus pumilus]